MKLSNPVWKREKKAALHMYLKRLPLEVYQLYILDNHEPQT